MQTTKLTEWYPPEIPPVREGVYQIADYLEDRESSWYSWWNGRCFGWRDKSIIAAYNLKERPTECSPNTHWRGLAEEPK